MAGCFKDTGTAIFDGHPPMGPTIVPGRDSPAPFARSQAHNTINSPCVLPPIFRSPGRSSTPPSRQDSLPGMETPVFYFLSQRTTHWELEALLLHLDITARTFFRALFTTLAKLHLKPIRFARCHGLDNRPILAEFPTGSAVETRSATHAAFCFCNRVFFRKSPLDFGPRILHPFLYR